MSRPLITETCLQIWIAWTIDFRALFKRTCLDNRAMWGSINSNCLDNRARWVSINWNYGPQYTINCNRKLVDYGIIVLSRVHMYRCSITRVIFRIYVPYDNFKTFHMVPDHLTLGKACRGTVFFLFSCSGGWTMSHIVWQKRILGGWS